jgi:hypothetical protein
MTASYTVRYKTHLPDLAKAWDSRHWAEANTLSIDNFHPQSSDHHPVVKARFLHNRTAIAGIYRVEDRYLIARQVGYQAMVCKDSCVEFFAQPVKNKGYINFEINCCGNLLCQYVEDPVRENGVFKKSRFVAEQYGRMVHIHTSLNGPITEELPGPATYTVAFQIPFAIFEAYVGSLGCVHGQVWRANCYKCADESSHPHWAAWSSVGENLNFHQPDKFGEFILE